MATAQDRYIFLNTPPTDPPPVDQTYLYVDSDGKLKSMDSDGNVTKYPAYDDGEWTPVPKIGSTEITPSSFYAEYTKIGKLVTVQCRTVFSIAGTETGVLTLDGLPFANNSDPDAYVYLGVQYEKVNYGTNKGPVVGRLDPSATDIGFYIMAGDGTSDSLDETDLSSNSNLQIRFSFSYRID